jgi:hypothetical protein
MRTLCAYCSATATKRVVHYRRRGWLRRTLHLPRRGMVVDTCETHVRDPLARFLDVSARRAWLNDWKNGDVTR